MSHVATVDLHIADLDCLAKAAKRIGMELRLGQTTYRWYGEHVGDYPLPQGFAVEDMGKCEHAITSPDKDVYEIGLVRRRDGRPGFQMLWDFIDDRLVKLVGAECCKLKQAYAAEVSIKSARMQGYGVREELRADGSLRITMSK